MVSIRDLNVCVRPSAEIFLPLALQALLSSAERRVEALRQDVGLLKQEREKLDVSLLSILGLYPIIIEMNGFCLSCLAC